MKYEITGRARIIATWMDHMGSRHRELDSKERELVAVALEWAASKIETGGPIGAEYANEIRALIEQSASKEKQSDA